MFFFDFGNNIFAGKFNRRLKCRHIFLIWNEEVREITGLSEA
jgi:hypothetical protein